MLAGAGLAFARAIGEFGSVVLISGNLPFKTEVASSWIYSLSQSDDLSSAAAVSVVLIAIALGVLVGIGLLRRRFDDRRVAVTSPLALAAPTAPPSATWACYRDPGRPRSSTGPSSTASVAALDAVTTPDALHALWLTLLVVLIAVPLDTVFGVGVALILARHRFPGAWLLDALVDIPLAISPVVIGLSLILVYGKVGWFGNWLAAHGIEVIFSVPGIVMASAAVALPYVVREVLPVLQEIGTEQEQAAATLGAGPVTTFRRITLPSHPTRPRLRGDPHHRPGARASSGPWPSSRGPSPGGPRR